MYSPKFLKPVILAPFSLKIALLILQLSPIYRTVVLLDFDMVKGDVDIFSIEIVATDYQFLFASYYLFFGFCFDFFI